MALTDIEAARKQLGTMTDILERHGYDTRRLVCPSPDHVDRRPGSVGIFTGRDGKERLKCHSCGFTEDTIGVARALGERVSFGPPPLKRREPPKPGENAVRTRLSKALENDATIEFDWIAAKKLAELPRLHARQDIVDNYDYLRDNGNIPRISDWSDKMREQAVERFGLPYKQALSRLIRTLEKKP